MTTQAIKVPLSRASADGDLYVERETSPAPAAAPSPR